jgi:hypothetical protein
VVQRYIVSGSSHTYTKADREWKTIQSGILQGPLFFSIYINDFPASVINNSDVIMYAHDTIILISSNCYKELSIIFNDVLFNIMK